MDRNPATTGIGDDQAIPTGSGPQAPGEPPRRPRTAAHPSVGYLGALVMWLAVMWVWYQDDISPTGKALWVAGLGAMFMLALDLTVFRVYERASTGLEWGRARPFDPARLFTKLIGLAATFGGVAFCYWVFPNYRTDFFKPAMDTFRSVLPVLLVLAPLYIAVVDRHMRNPEDGLYQAGCVATVRWREVNWPVFWNYCRGWLVKGFFLPLMFCYFVGSLTEVQHHLTLFWSALATFVRETAAGPMQIAQYFFDHYLAFYEFCYTTLFFFDLAFAIVGYSLTFRIFDNHIRSAEPTLAGWLAALVCYQPMWAMLSTEYFAYDDNLYWGPVLTTHPALQVVWGTVILVFVAIYAWATIVFGTRFSNLTHRGIITHGPYRLSKHPAYICKNVSWWMISLPFLNQAGWSEALRLCLLMLMVNAIYFARAKTEERHLSADPVYRAYQAYMADHSVIAVVLRKLGLRTLRAAA